MLWSLTWARSVKARRRKGSEMGDKTLLDRVIDLEARVVRLEGREPPKERLDQSVPDLPRRGNPNWVKKENS